MSLSTNTVFHQVGFTLSLKGPAYNFVSLSDLPKRVYSWGMH